MGNRRVLLLNMFEALKAELGPSDWWPAEDPFEVAVGAILTQNTNWVNVEKALRNLRREGLLDPRRLHALSPDQLAERIRPAGYFRLKAGRLKHFLVFLRDECGFDLQSLAQRDMAVLRGQLLKVKGVGPETADSILLYALNMPSFVVDAYTRRIMNRHALTPEDVEYDELQALFMDVLPEDTELYNEFHALLVRAAKRWCLKKQGLCGECPLRGYLP